MSNVNIQWNPGWEDELGRLVGPAIQKTEDAITQVSTEMAGQPAASVLAELRSRICQAGIEPNEDELRKVAEAISNRTPDA